MYVSWNVGYQLWLNHWFMGTVYIVSLLYNCGKLQHVIELFECNLAKLSKATEICRKFCKIRY